ncbi:MAG: RrF2 family transcriptional regulator [Planctomycetota bacterium]
MFSQTVEYALRTVLHLASSGRSCTTAEIAAATQVPRAYLSKVIQSLAQSGILASHRGAGGGVELLRAAEGLTILEVVNAEEPIQRIRTCPLNLPAHGVNLCPLHRRMDEALAMVERALRESTVGEVLSEPTTSIPLCNFPAVTDVRAAERSAPPQPHRRGP